MSLEQVIIFGILPLVGYLIGSIPFAFVIGRRMGIDIRTVGSRNIGATNLGRILGPRYFWYAFLLDAAKGFVPVLAAAIVCRYAGRGGVLPGGDLQSVSGLLAGENFGWRRYDGPFIPMWAPLLTAGACVMGHVFPVWLGFRGGKGVATGFGVVLGFWPLYTIAGLLAGACFVVVLMVYRYISLASMISAVAFVTFVATLGSWRGAYPNTYLPPAERWPLVGIAAGFALIIIWRHRANIVRLVRGTESRVGQREITLAQMRPASRDDPQDPEKGNGGRP